MARLDCFPVQSVEQRSLDYFGTETVGVVTAVERPVVERVAGAVTQMFGDQNVDARGIDERVVGTDPYDMSCVG